MLPVIAFVLFWVLLGVTLFFVATRGGIAGARETLQSQSRAGRRTATVFFVALYFIFGIGFPAAILTGNHAKASGQFAGVKLNASDKHAREVFGEQCGVCHTLTAANAYGKVGPNLDTLKPPASLVLNTINNGCVQNPPPGSNQACLGQGTMPPQIVQGKDAQDVANFVAKVAGKE